jgi:hypothetical protein
MIEFETINLNEKYYSRMIERIIYENYNVEKMLNFLNKWNITFYPLEKINIEFFEHVKKQGEKITRNKPCGVTGKFEIILYVHDSKNEFKTRENSDVIQHELAHGLLYDIYGNKKIEGKKYNLFVDAVHTRLNQRYTINFWFRRFFIWKKLQISLIDIRDLARL